jgi:uncharacterized protein YeaO (DUF488 family)
MVLTTGGDLMIKVKRAYDEVSDDDGYRILVGRLWPRGVTKERAALDLWLKDVAPSTELRKWFGHDPKKWEEFSRRYWKELESKPQDINILKQKIKEGPVTLIYSAHDTDHNAAVALKEFLERHEKIGIMTTH